MDANWLPFHPDPSKPTFSPPVGAVDAHCHVFGPGDSFPYAPERKYTPCDAPKKTLWQRRDHLGFERNVIVQASCHGTDNSALVDALVHSDGRARGVAVVSRDVSDDQLDVMHEAGVRAVRFNFVKRLVDVMPIDAMQLIVERIKAYGWHIVIYFEAQDLAEFYSFFTELPVTVVVDHMGRPDLSKPVEGAEFALFLKLLAENPNFYCKVTCPERLSQVGPPAYEDFVPFARRVVEDNPDRVLWGTDWPHPNIKRHMPNDGDLVDLIPLFMPDAELQQAVLVDNPHRLYRFA